MAQQKELANEVIDGGHLPRHIAIIMDGNGRWAQKRLMPRTIGHRAGMSALKEVVQACDKLHIPYLTVYAFSTENWKRPMTEISYLMNLLVEFLHKELDELHQNNVQINVMGDYYAMPPECQVEIKMALEKTSLNSGLVLNIALNYGSRQEIIDTVRILLGKAQNREIELDDINEEMFSQQLYTGEIPDPDLLIRTAGEKRISNFMLWQIAYTEIVVCDTLWPDFTAEDLIGAIREYQGRDRRFGGLNK